VPKLLIFPDPLNARCELRHDDGGIVVIGVLDTHSQGRKGQSFPIPIGLPQGHGARVFISSPGKVPLEQRGTLWYDDDTVEIPFPEGGACLFTDDFKLQNIPTPTPNPIPVPEDPNRLPFDIIMGVYHSAVYDLTTKEGCGIFTQDCCTKLHQLHSPTWGHIRKTGAQNQYNGHAVDAIQILMSLSNCAAGIYDIIVDSEASGARPGFNRTDNANQSLWFYPAN